LNTYLVDVGRHGLLTKSEVDQLGVLIADGRRASDELNSAGAGLPAGRRRKLEVAKLDGRRATEQLVKGNLRLVLVIARRYQHRGLSLLDLVQEGNIGLMRAAERFEQSRGFRFSTYATWWIRQAMARGIANTASTVRLPCHINDALKQVQRTQWKFEGERCRTPTPEELASELDLPAGQVATLLTYGREPRSLSEPLCDDGSLELGDLIEDRRAVSPFEAAARALLPDVVDRLLSVLSDRDREILRLRFGLDQERPLTLREIGCRFNLSEERIRQIEFTAIERLRRPGQRTSAALDLLAAEDCIPHRAL